MSSVIGVSQTEARIRRTLHRFHKEVKTIDSELNSDLRKLGDGGDDTARWFEGGLYSWHSSYG